MSEYCRLELAYEVYAYVKWAKSYEKDILAALEDNWVITVCDLRNI